MVNAEQPTFKQVEQQDFLAYSRAIIEVAEIAMKHYENHGKITRDGLVPRELTRKAWEHFLKNQCGVLWEANVVGMKNNGVSVIQPDAWEHLLNWFKEKVNEKNTASH